MPLACLELANGFHGNQNKSKLPYRQPTGSPLGPHSILRFTHYSLFTHFHKQAKPRPMPSAVAFELAKLLA